MARKNPVMRSTSRAMDAKHQEVHITVCSQSPSKGVKMAQIFEKEIQNPIVVAPPNSKMTEPVDKNRPRAVVHRVVIGMVSSAGVGAGFFNGQANAEIHPDILERLHRRAARRVVRDREVRPFRVRSRLPVMQRRHVVPPRVHRHRQEGRFVEFLGRELAFHPLHVVRHDGADVEAVGEQEGHHQGGVAGFFGVRPRFVFT